MYLNLFYLASLAFVSLSQASSLLPARAGRRIGCSADPSPDELSAIQALAEAESLGTVDSVASRATISISVYFHAIVNTSTTSYPSDALFQSQLSVMNTAYAPAGIQFVFAGSDRKKDNTLATGDGIFPDWNPSTAMQNYLKSVRSGAYADLNLFFYSNPPADTLGQCTFPLATVPSSSSLDFAKDGCHLATGTLPRQEITNYNLGMTAVHETGHWLSLLHPFTGYTCDTSNPGDYVDDTPQESTESYGCDTGKDSCPTVAGVDPIHNYSMSSCADCGERRKLLTCSQWITPTTLATLPSRRASQPGWSMPGMLIVLDIEHTLSHTGQRSEYTTGTVAAPRERRE